MDLSTYIKERTTQKEFAAGLGVTQSLVSQWLNRQTRLLPDHAEAIEAMTNGDVTFEDLRPLMVRPERCRDSSSS